MTLHSTNPGFYWYFYVDSPYSTAKSVDELLEWTEVLFDFDNVLKHHLPELRGHWIENPGILTEAPKDINVLSATLSFPRFLGNFIAGTLYALGRENEFKKFIGGPGVKTPAGDGRMVPGDLFKPVGELLEWVRIRPKAKLYVGMDFGAFDPTVHAILVREGKFLAWIFDNGRVYRMSAGEFIELALEVLVEGRNSINTLIERVNNRSSLAKATVRHVERFVDALT
ncbi:hypothetical protein [Thermococcus sp. 21S7]|uniref:hypothetical protein n=1 Tax=Thermococcus sp. 21S7 TaxID=1638221 RepID=UPI00143AA50C|nr:hypothetical protein [Thermococcus sp. 21S7]NJE61921.1 hypothetical protein [Thermococcus sp. 21S7]